MSKLPRIDHDEAQVGEFREEWQAWRKAEKRKQMTGLEEMLAAYIMMQIYADVCYWFTAK